jgi:hypothetical protein
MTKFELFVEDILDCGKQYSDLHMLERIEFAQHLLERDMHDGKLLEIIPEVFMTPKSYTMFGNILLGNDETDEHEFVLRMRTVMTIYYADEMKEILSNAYAERGAKAEESMAEEHGYVRKHHADNGESYWGRR